MKKVKLSENFSLDEANFITNAISGPGHIFANFFVRAYRDGKELVGAASTNKAPRKFDDFGKAKKYAKMISTNIDGQVVVKSGNVYKKPEYEKLNLSIGGAPATNHSIITYASGRETPNTDMTELFTDAFRSAKKAHKLDKESGAAGKTGIETGAEDSETTDTVTDTGNEEMTVADKPTTSSFSSDTEDDVPAESKENSTDAADQAVYNPNPDLEGVKSATKDPEVQEEEESTKKKKEAEEEEDPTDPDPADPETLVKYTVKHGGAVIINYGTVNHAEGGSTLVTGSQIGGDVKTTTTSKDTNIKVDGTGNTVDLSSTDNSTKLDNSQKVNTKIDNSKKNQTLQGDEGKADVGDSIDNSTNLKQDNSTKFSQDNSSGDRTNTTVKVKNSGSMQTPINSSSDLEQAILGIMSSKKKGPAKAAALKALLNNLDVVPDEANPTLTEAYNLINNYEDYDMTDEEFLEAFGAALKDKHDQECTNCSGANFNDDTPKFGDFNPGDEFSTFDDFDTEIQSDEIAPDEWDELWNDEEDVDTVLTEEFEDNAVVPCKNYKVVAHCDDEKPVCDVKKPLEEPLADKADFTKDLYEETTSTTKVDTGDLGAFDKAKEGPLWKVCDALNTKGKVVIKNKDQLQKFANYIPIYQKTAADGTRLDTPKNSGRLFNPDGSVKQIKADPVEDGKYSVTLTEAFGKKKTYYRVVGQEMGTSNSGKKVYLTNESESAAKETFSTICKKVHANPNTYINKGNAYCVKLLQADNEEFDNAKEVNSECVNSLREDHSRVQNAVKPLHYDASELGKNLPPYDADKEGILWDNCSFLESDGSTIVAYPEQAEAVIDYIPVYLVTDSTGKRYCGLKKKAPKKSSLVDAEGKVHRDWFDVKELGYKEYEITLKPKK